MTDVVSDLRDALGVGSLLARFCSAQDSIYRWRLTGLDVMTRGPWGAGNESQVLTSNFGDEMHEVNQ
jgi:hypothetical protein